MTLSDIPNEFIGWASAIVAGTTATLLGIQQSIKAWRLNSRDMERTKGETDVVALLRGELDRLSSQNDKLAQLVSKLQQEVFELSNKNMKLRKQIEMLSFDIKAIRGPQGLDNA